MAPIERFIRAAHKWGCRADSPSGTAPRPWAAAAGSAAPLSPTAAVRADHRADQLRRRLAVFLPSRLVIFPNWIHGFSDYSLHKLLHSGKSHSCGS